MVPGSSKHTSAARSAVELEIGADQAHQPMAIVIIELGGGQSRMYYNNQRNS